ncbi:hypothetical protein L6452_28021 [Arctium lappa]|uniref:Uncharacterized protein n=1 Tax=Arctium lappa TaxID=4217 RepID=A0ACB8ZYN5_ARCLA|nr:hypothetical protein L6452_28021 [Arctium lappa]
MLSEDDGRRSQHLAEAVAAGAQADRKVYRIRNKDSFTIEVTQMGELCNLSPLMLFRSFKSRLDSFTIDVVEKIQVPSGLFFTIDVENLQVPFGHFHH